MLWQEWQGPFLIRGRDSWAGHGRVTLQKSTLVVVCVWGQRIKERFSIRMLAVRERDVVRDMTGCRRKETRRNRLK